MIIKSTTGIHKKSVLGTANIKFEANISSNELISNFGENTFRIATMTVFNQNGEKVDLNVTDFVINYLREYEDEDDFNGEDIVKNTNES